MREQSGAIASASGVSRGVFFALAAAVVAMVATLVLVRPAHADEHESAVSAARASAAAEADVTFAETEVVRWDAVTWADACLGAPEEGEFCAQVQTDGFVVWVEANDTTFRYHADVAADDVRLARSEENVDPDDLQLPDGADARDVAPAPEPTTYVVQSGDTLFAIAARFGTTVTAIAEANNIVDVNRISVGQVLEIPVDDPPPAEPAPPETYTVQSGDTLGAIAARFGTTVTAIAEANNIADVNRISVGQVLTIPDNDVAGAVSYTVQPGDTLFAISARFDTTVTAIAQANNIADPNRISVGQVLTIPQ